MSATPIFSPANTVRTLSTRSILVASLAALAFAPALFAQTTAPTTTTGTLLLPPSTAPAPTVAVPTPTSMPATMTQEFVGTITADRVYVRSGPGGAYYELGQLSKGDLVQVVGSRMGWYQILPPNGTFCMVAKDLVEVDAAGTSGTVKADYVNVHAGTALSKSREPSAVLTVVRKGTKLTVLGTTDKYYEVDPPEKAYVFVSPQFVKAAGGGMEYRVPELKLPAGTAGPARNTVSAPTTLPAPTVEIMPPSTEPAVAAGADNTTTVPPASVDHTVVVAPQPTTTFSSDAYTRFNELNARYQAELHKPVGTRDLDGLITDYKSLAGSTGLPPSVAQGSEARIAALEKLAAIQRLTKENAESSDALVERQRALQQQYAQAEQAIKDYEQTGPYLMEGRLQTSTAVEGKYALVNPSTGRVVAYVDPQSDIDIGSLLGKYIGVRGSTHTAEGSNMTVIQVKNATLLPMPEGSGAATQASR
jgi:uncharacterized protein YgiM (DUF1202 family)